MKIDVDNYYDTIKNSSILFSNFSKSYLGNVNNLEKLFRKLKKKIFIFKGFTF